MFPTSGYFRSIPCPFYITGFCERSQCHFRHVKSESESPNTDSWREDESVAGADQSQPYLLRYANQLLRRAEKEYAADKLNVQADTEQTQDYREEIEIRDTLLDEADLLIPNKNGIIKDKSKQQKAPEYTPTPIAKLKLLNLKGRPKKIEPKVPKKAASVKALEYDPTEVCSTSKVISAIGYNPSPKVSGKSKPKKLGLNEQSATSFESLIGDDGGDVLVESDENNSSEPLFTPTFSDDEDTQISTNKQLTAKVVPKLEECKDVDSNFDVVKRILNASTMCESVISASSFKKTNKTQAVKSDSSSNKKTNKGDSSVTKKSNTNHSNFSTNKTKVDVGAKSSGDKCNSKSKSKETETKTKPKKLSPVKKKENNGETKTSKIPRQDGPAVTKSNDSSTKSATQKVSTSIYKSDSEKKKVSSTLQRTQSPVKCNGVKNEAASPTLPPATIAGGGANESLFSDSEEDSDDDPDRDDTYEECLKIFNEYDSQQVENPIIKRFERKSTEDVDCPVIGKKRIAHDGGVQPVKKQKLNKFHQPSPSCAMQNRLLQSLQVYKVEKTITSREPTTAEEKFGKRRIAHTPVYQPPSQPKQQSLLIFSDRPSTSQTMNKPTLVQTLPKFTSNSARVAHTPSQTALKRPMIAAEFGCRVPVNIRQRYLNIIIEECLKIYDAELDAFDRAVSEEKSSYDRSSSRTIYINSVVIAIKNLRSELCGQLPPPKPTQSQQLKAKSFCKTLGVPSSRPPPQQRLVSHEAILNGKKGANLPIGVQKKKLKPYEEPITGAKLYNSLKQYLLSKEQLENNGFPMAHPTEIHRAVILKPTNHKSSTNVKSANPLEKICARCGSSFEVSPNGVYITKSECFYHWGRVYKSRVAGSIEGKYSCCKERSHSAGCCVAELHVFDDVDYDNLKGFVKTLPKSPPWDGNCGTFAIDCEMSYTNRGIELVRVTVIGADLQPVYETFVKPESTVIDYNTRFSGITKQDLDNVATNIRDVQAVLLSLFNDQTILVGHSLESDLKALKLIHGTVVDTSVVFPHRLGPPFKRALRNLTTDLLGKIIQNDVNGHDSQEDAVACMELMLYKIREDMKKLI